MNRYRSEIPRWRKPGGLPADTAYVFVTYRAPRDFPGGYVLRAFRVADCELEPADLLAAGTLYDCRTLLNRGRKTLAAGEADHPIIFEYHY